MPPNPIYERMTRGAKGPSQRVATWIGIGVGVAVFAAASAPVMQPHIVSIVVFGLSVVMAALVIPIECILAALITTRHTLDEDYALLRLTHLTGAQIVTAYLEGVRYRLRVIRSIGQWCLLGAVPIVADTIARDVAVIGCQGMGSCIAEGLAPALVGVGFAMVLLSRISKFLIAFGVWIGLRWTRRAVAVTGGVMASLVALGSLVIALAFGSLYTSSAYWTLSAVPYICLAGVILVPVLTVIAERAVLNDAARFIDGQTKR